MESWRDDPATERQRAFAKELGVKIPSGATKGEASDIISEAKEIQGTSYTYSGSTSISFKERIKGFFQSLLKKIFVLLEIILTICIVSSFMDRRYGQGLFFSIFGFTLLYCHLRWLFRKGYSFNPIRLGFGKSEPDLIHGIEGSYDKSYFENPKTGMFQFPKHKHTKEYLVKITDNTEYKYFWEDFSAEEKREYTISDFETDVYMSIEIDVEPLESLFYKSSKSHLEPLGYLKGKWSLVDKILSYDDEWITVDIDMDAMGQLLSDGYLFECMISSDKDKLKYYQSFNMPILKEACKNADLNITNKKKREIVDCMISSGKSFDLPKAVIRSPKFDEWYGQLLQNYIEDIQNNANRFHPLYHEPIWESVSEQFGHNVKKHVNEIIASGYWKERLMT